uniref:BatD family protein n=1 Tax=Alloprevotella sp. TaxID=1872471 RepID=UPI0040286D5D
MAPINAQLKLSVNAPSIVEANPSYFQIKYTLNSDYAISFEDISDFHFSTADFTQLSKPGYSIRKEDININGRARTNCSVTITCTLRPKAKGTFIISPASVHVKGKTYKSKAVKIRVADNAQGNGNRASSSQNDKTEEENAMRTARTGLSQKDLCITADLQKTTVYEQEAVRLKYHALALPGVGLSNTGLNEKPDFKNIVSLEIPTNPEFTLAHVNGVAYKKYKAKEYVLYPQKAGQIQIPKLTFDCMVMQRDILLDRIDDFLNGGGIGVNVKRSAPQLVLNVKPLPTPKPSGFSGGVGHFKIKSQMRTANLRTNDLATFRITIYGTGNLKLITAPDLVFPEGFDSYPPQIVDETTITEDGVSGSISFDYTLVPREVGKFEMPKVDFVFFDPQKEEYQTITA